jgi:hypothetical protein
MAIELTTYYLEMTAPGISPLTSNGGRSALAGTNRHGDKFGVTEKARHRFGLNPPSPSNSPGPV